MDQDVERRTFLRQAGLLGAGGVCAMSLPPGLSGCAPSGSRKSKRPLMNTSKNNNTLVVHDPFCREHLTGFGHPERPERYSAVIKALSEESLSAKLEETSPRQAKDEELRLCHTPDYVELVKREITEGYGIISTGDTVICKDSLKAAYLAAGCSLTAVEAVLTGKAKNAFSASRPPGHHATQDAGMGFCLFNNVGVAARYAQKEHGIGKVLIADWDVHHGNGTQNIFYEDDTVFFFSTHQYPWYPGTGAADETGKGKGKGCNLNCPFPAHSGTEQIVDQAFAGKLVEAADKFKPDLVIISAGFDSHRGDPLGEFLLEDEDFVRLTEIMLGIAKTHAEGRLISTLEGGYALGALSSATAAHVGALADA